MKLLNALVTIFIPSTWFMQSPFNKKCEKFSVEALKKPVFTDISRYECNFNGKYIWISNRPYGFEFTESRVRPSRRTVLKIHEALDEVRFK